MDLDSLLFHKGSKLKRENKLQFWEGGKYCTLIYRPFSQLQGCVEGNKGLHY